MADQESIAAALSDEPMQSRYRVIDPIIKGPSVFGHPTPPKVQPPSPTDPAHPPQQYYMDPQPRPLTWEELKQRVEANPNAARPNPQWAIDEANRRAEFEANSEAVDRVLELQRRTFELLGSRLYVMRSERESLYARIGALRLSLANLEIELDGASTRAAAGDPTARDDMLIVRKSIEKVTGELVPAEQRFEELNRKLTDPAFCEQARQNDEAHGRFHREFMGSVDRQKQLIETQIAELLSSFVELGKLVDSQGNAMVPILERDRALGIQTPALRLDSNPALHGHDGRARFFREALERALRERFSIVTLELW